MATDIAITPAAAPPPHEFPTLSDPDELVHTDGEPLDSDWHFKAVTQLVESTNQHFREREDFYSAGNMFVYFSADWARNRDFRGPDYFFVRDVNRRPLRLYWATWLEGGRYPDLIIELLSPSTAIEDLTKQKDVYERIFRSLEYFCYDPRTEELTGWRLEAGRYRLIPLDANGRMHSEVLDLWVGKWRGPFYGYVETWLRFFEKDGQLVLTGDEVGEINTKRAELLQRNAEEATKRADDEKNRAEAEKQRADAEKQRAEAEKLRAEAERQRADQAESELKKLRRLLHDRQAK
jgi:Uma2 family endonuclease